MRLHVRDSRVLFVALCLVTAAGAVPASQAPLFPPNADPRTPVRLTVAMAADAAAIVPGRPVTLRLDMVPAPGIHVYAPGNTDYIPVAVTLTPPAGVQTQPALYPRGQDYLFGELKETVKVYSRPFQVRQQIVVSRAAAKAAGRSITLVGSVRYQACDDKVCFPPATAPISITLPIAGVAAATSR
jgi:DsbC/DsbD-like thiol-disulfide interchange protein